MIPHPLEIAALNKSFGGVAAVRDLSFAVDAHRITGLIGPNGAGKTTIFNLVTGFVRPDSGTIRFAGQDVTGLRPEHLARLGIGRSFQDIRLFGQMSVRDNVAMALPNQRGEHFFPALFGRIRHEAAASNARAMELLAFVGMEHKAETPAEDLSYGQQKLVLIARLLALDPALLLLDEPCSGLDPTMLARVVELLQRLAGQQRTIVLIEHNMDVVREVAEHVVFLAEGHALASGPTAQVLADPALTRIYFGM